MQSYQPVTQETISQVRVGAHVVVELIDEQGAHERLEFDLVPDAFADFDNGLLGVQTPLGKAILGKRSGAMVGYRTVTQTTDDRRRTIDDRR